MCFYLGLMRIVCGILGKGSGFPKKRTYPHFSPPVKFSTYAMAYVHGKSSSRLVWPGPGTLVVFDCISFLESL